MTSTALIADNDESTVHLVGLYLGAEGYKVASAADGQEAIDKARRLHPDLVILDLMMPRLDGFEVCRRLRRESNVPIIMLTARTDDVDKIVGLELGADDYVTKPFNPRELVARVRSVLRRAQSVPEPDRAIQAADVRVDPARREVYVGDREVVVGGRHFDLLLVLAREQGRVLTRETLLTRVWGHDFMGDSRTVDVHVAGLRSKLAGAAIQIQSVRGLGYKLLETARAPRANR